LQDERSKILEEARAREAGLQAQLESRTRELAVVAEKSAAVIGYARVELERLDKEQRQAAAVESEMGAFFANLNRQVEDNRLDEADASIKAMRDFINTPAFQSLRSIQARKDMYIRAITSFETMIDENKKYQALLNDDSGTGNPLSALQARIAQLEKDLEEKDKTIEAVSSQGSGISRRLNDLQADKRQLERANTALQTQNTQLERTNGALQTQNRQLENANGALRTQNTQLTADLERQNQAAASLQQNLTQTTAQFQQATRDLQAEKAETARLTQTVSERDTTIRSRETTITNRNDVIARIRTEVDLDRDYDEIPPIEIKARITRIQNALRSVQ
jgi:predicted  nucleic acid-binding Zn-ribbon protein